MPSVTFPALFILRICLSDGVFFTRPFYANAHVRTKMTMSISVTFASRSRNAIVVRGECRVPSPGCVVVWERRGSAHLAHALCVNSTRAAAKGAPSTRQTHPEEKMLSTNAQVHSKELEMSLACASRNKWPDREKKIFFISFKGKTSLLWTEFEQKKKKIHDKNRESSVQCALEPARVCGKQARARQLLYCFFFLRGSGATHRNHHNNR